VVTGGARKRFREMNAAHGGGHGRGPSLPRSLLLSSFTEINALVCVCVCVYYCRTYYKAVRVGEEDSGGHVL